MSVEKRNKQKIEKPVSTKTTKIVKPVKQAVSSSKGKTVKPKSNITTNISEAYMTQSKTKFGAFPESATNAGKEQFEAFIKSGDIFMKGFEGILKSYVSLTQNSVEKNAQTLQALASCKSPDDFTEIQKSAQKSYDEWVSSTTELSEQYVKITTEAFEPIGDQVDKVVKNASSGVAA